MVGGGESKSFLSNFLWSIFGKGGRGTSLEGLMSVEAPSRTAFFLVDDAKL